MVRAIILTVDAPPKGYRVKEIKGLVYASRPVSLTVAGLEAELSAIIERLRSEAERKGANAVLGTRIEVQRVAGVGGEWVLLLSYGTAVVLEKEEAQAGT
ncbi:heavy metal-binding domain-containing protein [Hyperthermus butylicus]|uniref:Uncharacterized protein n=1 Tax=Hyperthermus butylicus (strain DSM 5456 / JCM 9403 / PLM1-5) TaxID=415426 RepID=A2BN11_HYPBU|nr:heavy metal-binding domain-containing protein [Hyperthermus butylicus]ABM81372.1 hypothetical protein Hbut_1551 [Hyperthermus butylicus DSM 5456]